MIWMSSEEGKEAENEAFPSLEGDLDVERIFEENVLSDNNLECPLMFII